MMRRPSADQPPPLPRVRRLLGALATMRPDTAVKWSALSMGGSVGLVAAVIVVESVVRWLVELMPLVGSVASWLSRLMGLLF